MNLSWKYMKAFIVFSLLLKMFKWNYYFSSGAAKGAQWFVVLLLMILRLITALGRRFSSSPGRNQYLKGELKVELLSVGWVIENAQLWNKRTENKFWFDILVSGLFLRNLWTQVKLEQKQNDPITRKGPREPLYRRIVSNIMEYLESLGFHNRNGLIGPHIQCQEFPTGYGFTFLCCLAFPYW